MFRSESVCLVDGARVASRASRGEISFDATIDLPARQTIREMWMNRLAGFHRYDLNQYLRDNTESTQFIIDGRVLSDGNLRRVCRILFPLQRAGGLIGATLALELLDGHTTHVGDRFLTRCVVVMMLGGCIVRQSRLQEGSTHGGRHI